MEHRTFFGILAILAVASIATVEAFMCYKGEAVDGINILMNKRDCPSGTTACKNSTLYNVADNYDCGDPNPVMGCVTRASTVICHCNTELCNTRNKAQKVTTAKEIYYFMVIMAAPIFSWVRS